MPKALIFERLYLKPQEICARTLPKSPENMTVFYNKLLWGKKNMNLCPKRFLSLLKKTPWQNGQHMATDYYTHIEISCQCGRQTASYITVLSIIPLQ
jgi:hypothetical protein